MSDLSDEDAHRAARLVEFVKPFFEGQGADVQSAALADLLSMWAAGHLFFDDDGNLDRAETDQLRETILTNVLQLARDLLPANEKMLLKKLKDGAH
jgi:hypothetical protein